MIFVRPIYFFVSFFDTFVHLPNGFVIKVNIEEDGARILVKKGKYLMTCIYDESIIYQKLSLDEQLINRIESLL